MYDSQLNTIDEIKNFLNSTNKVSFKAESKEEVYGWVKKILIKFGYAYKLSREEKGLVKRYIKKVTGYSRAQVTRLSSQYRETGYVRVKEYQRHKFRRVYQDEDIRLLAKADELHEFPNGAALKKILEREVFVYGQKEYANIAKISVAHIYNLRDTPSYQRVTKAYKKTKPCVVNIGERKKPEPDGKPGFLRIDTVHQGDEDKVKGVYHINIIDEATQAEFVGAAERISEECMVPLLEALLAMFWFRAIEFHADNGSEYINHQVASLLNRLLIKLTKSRTRQTNDNALVEGKNGSIIRKWLGYGFIRQEYADQMNKFYFGCFNEYLNFHRPCGFAKTLVDKHGKIKKVYKPKDYQTPYEKFKRLENAEQYLREGVTFQELDKVALRYTDNKMAQIVQDERRELFEEILIS